jgi:hypothetical protein
MPPLDGCRLSKGNCRAGLGGRVALAAEQKAGNYRNAPQPAHDCCGADQPFTLRAEWGHGNLPPAGAAALI